MTGQQAQGHARLMALIFIYSYLALASEEGLIFPPESRQERFAVSSTAVMRKAAHATAGMVYQKMMSYSEKDHRFNFLAPNFEERHGTCPGHPYAQQPAPVLCTGFLVDQKLLVTAGHCMRQSYDCTNNYWVFDFAYDSLKDKDLSVHESQVYRCRRVVHSEWDPKEKIDYAVVELDRPATDREYLRLGNGWPELGEELFMPGHGGGLPMKVTTEGTVLGNTHPHFFQAALDAMGGNSGSPVVSLNSGEVQGLLVRGGNAPEWEIVDILPKNHQEQMVSCKREFVCDKSCSGVEVSRASDLLF